MTSDRTPSPARREPGAGDAVFRGSALAADYVFDLAAPVASHPPDVQAYLYALSLSPTPDGRGWASGMAEGRALLRRARAEGQGFFLAAPPAPEAMRARPHFPWLHNVSRERAYRATRKVKMDYVARAVPGLAPVNDVAWRADAMALTNARVPVPDGLRGPGDARWVEQIACLYAHHPVAIRIDLTRRGGPEPSDAGLRRYRDGCIWSIGDFGGDEAAGEAMMELDCPGDFESGGEA